MTSEGRLLCALSNWYAGDGIVDKEIDELGRLTSRLARWSGARLRPTNSSYLYYARGDFLGIHRDHVSCPITLLVWLSGPAGPLHVHPELHKVDEQVLLGTANTWSGHPPGGVDVDIRRAPVLLPGNVVPHDRPPHGHDEELGLATFCFALAEGVGDGREGSQ
jgi:hypothetical protein